jgi:predicted nucleotidyltransferase
LDSQELEERLQVQPGVLDAENLTDTLVLLEDLGRENQLEPTVPPRLEDPAGDSSEENGRDEDVGVKNDPHREARTLATARFTSADFMPAFRAAPRALRPSSSILRGELGVRALLLFGSVARGEAQSSSDVDLLVEFDRPVGLLHFVHVRDYLQDLLGVPVDLVTEDALRPEQRATILRDALRAA